MCAACGKGGEGEGLKTCNSCKEVKYCNAVCQRAHWVRHKKDCKQRAAEIRDEALFKDPIKEECPICFLPHIGGFFSGLTSRSEYKSCCGKVICHGCMFGMMDINANNEEEMFGDCPFCRAPQVAAEEDVERLKKRMALNDANAIYTLGQTYFSNADFNRAFDLWLKAAQLGCAEANSRIGSLYSKGSNGVAKDMKKAKSYWEIAAMVGSLEARYNLAIADGNEGRAKQDGELTRRALRQHIIAGKAGYEPSLLLIKDGFSAGYITKDEYTSILRAYQKSADEMKSDMRENAAKLMQLYSRSRHTQDPLEIEEIADLLARLVGKDA